MIIEFDHFFGQCPKYDHGNHTIIVNDVMFQTIHINQEEKEKK